ncbi:MAG: hypothetical protein Q8R49_01885 [Rhodoferax sp.]|nr:hypothetical protein [Rhodoferax sp.]
MISPCVAFGASHPGGRHPQPGKAGSALSAGARWWVVGAIALLFAATGASAQDASTPGPRTQGTVPAPVIEAARAGACVEDPATMRRNHMQFLMHQRDDTLRGGNRSGKYSLKACIACHASQISQSVNAQASNFCQSCHTYAAVKIDCFECHANKPASAPARQQVKS